MPDVPLHRFEPPENVPAVLIEVQDVLGPQPDSGYVDATGQPTGTSTCAVCGVAVLVAHHHSRPDGARPVILDARTHPRGPWRLFAKRENPGVWLASFDGAWSPHAKHLNHRIICPAASVDSTDGNDHRSTVRTTHQR